MNNEIKPYLGFTIPDQFYILEKEPITLQHIMSLNIKSVFSKDAQFKKMVRLLEELYNIKDKVDLRNKYFPEHGTYDIDTQKIEDCMQELMKLL